MEDYTTQQMKMRQMKREADCCTMCFLCCPAPGWCSHDMTILAEHVLSTSPINQLSTFNAIKDCWHAWVEQGWDYDDNDRGGERERCAKRK